LFAYKSLTPQIGWGTQNGYINAYVQNYQPF
jgi:hypothetical protein